MTFETKDSGKRAEYDSGMVRDTEDSKPRFDLLIAKEQPYDDQFMVLWREGGGETYYAPYDSERSAEQMAVAANAAEDSMILWLSSDGNTKSALHVATMLEAYEYYAWKEAGYGDDEDQWPYKDQLITRFAELMARGAEKYGDRNWEKGHGQAELDRARSSAYRHLKQWVANETDEDHAAAVLFNLMAAEYFQWKMLAGRGKIEEKPTIHITHPIGFHGQEISR